MIEVTGGPEVSSKISQSPTRAHNEGFTEGGDLTLRTLDDVEFHVHSIILSLASPVLANMISIGTQRDVVVVAETAEIVALMLSFIYPRPPLPVPSFEILRLGVHVADKYELDFMKKGLREQLSLIGSPVSVSADPLGALAFATAHGFREEAKLAASHASKDFDFQKIEDLLKLIDSIPSSAPLVQIIGTPFARASILFDVLFNFHQAPMAFSRDKHGKFLCGPCDTKYLNRKNRSPPEWLARWSYWVFQELKTRPLSDCADLFTPGFVNVALYRDRLGAVQEDLCKCQGRIGTYQNEFEGWADGVFQCLMKRLEEVDRLGSL